MKTYNVSKDLYLIRKYFGKTQSEIAKILGISRQTIYRIEKGDSPTKNILEKIYSYSYKNGLDINKNKSIFFFEEKKKNVLLFHGTNVDIVTEIDVNHSIPPNDFGDAFYAGVNLRQAVTWVASEENASVYCFYFNEEHFKKIEFDVDRKWLYAILYYRGAFIGKKVPQEILEIVKEIEEADYLIAPIADNLMYKTIGNFIDNLITDEACIHALSATDLGKQYVFKNNNVCKKIECIDRLYLCEEEKKDYILIKNKQEKESSDKVKLAEIEYRRKGLFFDELFKGI